MLKALLDENLIIENDYYKNYLELIEVNLGRKYEKYMTEKHHIIPRCYFKRHQPELETDNSKENLVNLYHKDHLLAHYYLAKCSNGWLRFYLLHAFYQLFNRLNKDKDKSSEKIIDDELLNHLDDYQELFEEALKLKSELYKGRKQTEESKQKRLRTRLERYPNGVKTNLGKKRLTKNGVIIFVPISQLDDYFKSGWILDKKAMSEESKQKMRKTKALNKKTAWNKGLTKETDERVAKNALNTSKSIQKLKLENPEFWAQHIVRSSKNKKGSIVVTNGTEDRMIPKEMLEQFLSNGYKKGRTFKKSAEQNRKSSEKHKGMKPGNFGKICIFNPDTNHRTYIFEQDLEMYEELGYHRGRK